MKYTAVYRSWLLSVALEAPPSALGSWLRIAAYAAELECGEPGTEVGEARLVGARNWGDRTWLRAAGVELSEVAEVVEAGLARWGGDDLIVGGYDSDGHRVVQAKRAAGKHGVKGGRPRKNPEGKTQRVSGSKPTGETHDITPLPTYPTYLPTPPDAPARDAPSAPKLDTRKIAKVYRVATGNTDLPELPFEWRPKQSMAVTDLARWCGGDCAKLDAELRRLKASDAWLAKQPVHVWAERVGTGAPPAETVDPYAHLETVS